MDLMGQDETPFVQRRDVLWIISTALVTGLLAMNESLGIIALKVLGATIFCVLGFRFIPDEATSRWIKITIVTSLCVLPTNYIVNYIYPQPAGASSAEMQLLEQLNGNNNIKDILEQVQ